MIFLYFWSSAKENYRILYTFLKCISYIFVIYSIRSFFWVVIHIFTTSGSKVIDILINSRNRSKKSLILMKKCWYQQNFAKFCQILNINTIFLRFSWFSTFLPTKMALWAIFADFIPAGYFPPPPGRLGGILTPGRLGLIVIPPVNQNLLTIAHLFRPFSHLLWAWSSTQKGVN